MAASDEGPLERWSRRKREARAEPRDRLLADEAITDTLETDVVASAGSADAAPAELDVSEVETIGADTPPLTPVEELDAESDYTQYLAEGVPEELTRAALRKLWLSDPVFANLDGLNDYDEDFNLIDKIIAVADTHDKIARGTPGGKDAEASPGLDEETSGEAIADAGKITGQDVEGGGEVDAAQPPDSDESAADGEDF